MNFQALKFEYRHVREIPLLAWLGLILALVVTAGGYQLAKWRAEDTQAAKFVREISQIHFGLSGRIQSLNVALKGMLGPAVQGPMELTNHWDVTLDRVRQEFSIDELEALLVAEARGAEQELESLRIIAAASYVSRTPEALDAGRVLRAAAWSAATGDSAIIPGAGIHPDARGNDLLLIVPFDRERPNSTASPDRWVIALIRTKLAVRDLSPRDSGLIHLSVQRAPDVAPDEGYYVELRQFHQGADSFPVYYYAHAASLFRDRSPQPLSVLVIGLLVTLLLFHVFWGFATTQIRAREIAKRMLQAEQLLEENTRLYHQDLRSSRERFEMAIRGYDGFWEWEVDPDALHLNPGFMETIGLRDSRPLKSADFLQTYVHPEDRTAVAKLFSHSGAHQAEYDFQCRLKTSAGVYRWFRMRGQGFLNGETQVRAAGSIADIEEQMQTEAELRRTKQEAERISLAKGQFLANMSHEIRTPMNAVVGMAGLLLRSDLPAKSKRFAEIIHSSAENLLTTINEVLDFSKIEAGKLAIEIIDFDLAETVESVAQLFAERAHSKGVELLTWIRSDIPLQVRGDPVRIRQLLINLVSNAVKFTEEGQVSLEVHNEWENPERMRIRFQVIDTGIGIDEKARAFLFEPFTQADGSTTRRFGGTGLGLTISKQLVELMHGAIGFDSELNKGSRFWFTVELEKRSEQRTAISPLGSPLTGARALVVSPIVMSHEILRDQLESWSMRVDTVTSGAAALNALKHAAQNSDPFHVALIDYRLSDMEGISLARKIRSDPANDELGLTLATTLNDHPETSALKALRISASLVKPPKISDLFSCLITSANSRGSATDTLYLHRAKGKRGSDDPGAIDLSSLRILLAEDNPVNQMVALQQLDQLGCKADIVATGVQAIEALMRASYHVVLMDCQMPELDGYDATRQIRVFEREGVIRAADRRRLFIIAMTAHAMEGDREKCFAVGMDDYLSKPARLEDLERVLIRALPPADPAGHEAPPRSVVEPATAPLMDTVEAPPPELAGDPPEAAPLDAKVFAELRRMMGNNIEDLRRFVTIYNQETPEQLNQIRESLKDRDYPRLRNAAHKLKGSAAGIGARQLAALCSILQEKATAQDPDTAEEILRQIVEEFSRASRALAAEAEMRE